MEEEEEPTVPEIPAEDVDKEEETPVQEELPHYPEYICDQPWTLVCSAPPDEFKSENYKQTYLKGCKWSPDGTCLLTCAADDVLRLFDLPAELYASHKKSYQGCTISQISPSLRIKEGGLIYDYCWHPHMSSWSPETCLLACTAKGGPTHFWDAYKGNLAATYRAYNNVDEVEAAVSLCISPDGLKLYCGFDKCVRIFDVQIPGRECETRLTKSTDGISASQSGLISCIAVNPALPTVYAAASYMKTIGLYSEPDGTALCVLEGHRGGVTHLKFSPDGMMFYSGGRKDGEIIGWDLRNPGQVLFSMKRTVETNQRIYFDLDPSGRYLFSGDTGGLIRVWDTLKSIEISNNLPEVVNYRLHNDCLNGVSCHPWLPLVATSSGQRHIINSEDSSESENEDADNVIPENAVKIWWAGRLTDELSAEFLKIE